MLSMLAGIRQLMSDPFIAMLIGGVWLTFFYWLLWAELRGKGADRDR